MRAPSSETGPTVPRDRLLTAEDVAELIGMRTDYVYALARSNQIPHLRFGRTLRFRRASVDAWIRAVESGTLTRSEETAGRRGNAPGPARR